MLRFILFISSLLYVSSEVSATCTRVVSLSPSVTETLFAMNMGDHVVARTRYSDFPPEVASIISVGDPFAPSIETILSLKTDLVIGISDHHLILERLRQLHLKTLEVDHRSIAGLLASIATIGEECGNSNEASKLSARLALHMRQEPDNGRAVRPRAAIIVASSGPSQEAEYFLSGNDGYYSELIALAGGENAFRGRTVRMPSFSAEGLVALRPDVVFLIGVQAAKVNLSTLREFLPAVPVHALTADYAEVPGPRFILLLDDFKKGLWSK